MGRTKRIRKRSTIIKSFEDESFLIDLKKFMIKSGYENDFNLKLKYFRQTGRGVSCKKSLQENDILIQIPVELLITYHTVIKDNLFIQLFTSKLKIQELLAAFLVYERHKKNSYWKDYINSLPEERPWLPSLMSERHIDAVPPDLRLEIKKSRRLIEESWSRLRKSIRPDWICNCCCNKANRVFGFHAFLWGFIMVNTRAVYIDLNQQKQSQIDILLDQPSMALCPYLDMFNHDFNAKTKAEITTIRGQSFYQLKTLSRFKKHEQIFISYGNHDNIKLLVEYGFFIPGNFHDVLSFSKEEVEEILDVRFNCFQHEFLKKHSMDEDLYFTNQSVSFKLKALLYVMFAKNLKDWTSSVYNGKYSEDFEPILKEYCNRLLKFKLVESEKLLDLMKVWSDVNAVLIDYFRCRVNWIGGLINKQQFIDL